MTRNGLRTGDCVLLNLADVHDVSLQYMCSAPAGPESRFGELRCGMKPPLLNAPRTDLSAFRIVACANDDQVSRSLQQNESEAMDLRGMGDFGTPVHYGQHVRLQHVRSERLLSISPHHRGEERFSMGIMLQPAGAEQGVGVVLLFE